MKSFLFFLFLSIPLFGEQIEALLIPYRLVELVFPQEGVIRDLKFKEGDRVSKDDVMAIQEDLNESLRLEHASKVLEQRKFDAESHQKLFDKNMVSKDVFLEKKLGHEVALIDQKRAEAQLQQRRLLAPFDGLVVRRNRQEGEWSRSGEPLYQLLDPNSLYAEALLEPERASLLKVGQSITIMGKSQIQGKVEFISPLIDATSNLVRVKIFLDNRKLNWKPGSTVSLEFP